MIGRSRPSVFASAALAAVGVVDQQYIGQKYAIRILNRCRLRFRQSVSAGMACAMPFG